MRNTCIFEIVGLLIDEQDAKGVDINSHHINFRPPQPKAGHVNIKTFLLQAVVISHMGYTYLGRIQGTMKFESMGFGIKIRIAL